MRRLVSICGALAALSSSALAADLPSRKAPPVYAPLPPVFTWTGAYVGVTAGYSFDNDHTFRQIGNDPTTAGALAAGFHPTLFRNRSDGFTGGGEIGYNYQFANTSYFGGTGGVVVGVEADAMYVGPSQNGIYLGGGRTTFLNSKTDFVGTARGRLGYAFNNFLVYGTGGFAYGGVDDSLQFVSPAGVTMYRGVRSTIKTGYAYGGGIAYAIPTNSFLNFFHSSAVTLKVEYLHYDLGSSALFLPNAPSNGAAANGTSFTSRIRSQGNLIRAGLDYKFDFFAPPAPIVAKY